MGDFEKLIMAIFGGVLTLAIVSVIISKKSQAPQVIQASASALSNVIGAAVNPVQTSATNGNNGSNPFSTPQIPGGSDITGLLSSGLMSAVTGGAFPLGGF